MNKKSFPVVGVMCLALFMTGCTIGKNDGNELIATLETSEISETAGTLETVARSEVPVENRVAALFTKTAKGSCIILYAKDGEYILATASHVAGDLQEVSLDGREVQVTQYSKSSDFDLTFLCVQMPVEAESSLQYEPVGLQAYNDLKEGDVIGICGSVADEKVYQEGSVLSPWIYMEDFGYHMLWGEVSDVKGGMSGGGVFDGNGRLVGMIVGGDGDKQIAVLPISILAAEWKNSDLDAPIDIFIN